MLVFNFLHHYTQPKRHHSISSFSSPSLNDHELVSAIEHGSLKSMKILYDKYFTSLDDYIENRLSDLHYKADILENTLLDIWNGSEKWNRIIELKVFIFSIIRKKIDKINCFAIFRNSKRKSIPATSTKLIKNYENPVLYDQPLSLPMELKSLIHMVYNESLTYEQIAIIENCTVNVVERRFLCAISILKNLSNSSENIALTMEREI